MTDDKKYYWLKLKENFFRDKEIKKLRKIAGGDTFTIIYLKLQLLSLKNEGKLIFENLEDTFYEEIALELDEDSENVKVTLLYLQKCGLLEEVAENEFILPQTIKCIGGETQGAERVRRHREKVKMLPCNTQVTNSNTEIEKEKEIEIEIEIEIEKKIKKKTAFDILIENYTSNEKLRNTIYDFIKMRKAIKAMITDNALKLTLSKLDKLSKVENEKISILEQSVMNSWKGIFELKRESKIKTFHNFTGRNYTEEEFEEMENANIENGKVSTNTNIQVLQEELRNRRKNREL